MDLVSPESPAEPPALSAALPELPKAKAAKRSSKKAATRKAAEPKPRAVGRKRSTKVSAIESDPAAALDGDREPQSPELPPNGSEPTIEDRVLEVPVAQTLAELHQDVPASPASTAGPSAPDPVAPPSTRRRAFPSENIDDDALKVLKRLHRHGHKAYLVGGGVRDLLLGRKPKDFDVATSARPSEVKSIFRNCRIIGRRFRLAHILFAGGKVIETATFRRDPTANNDDDALAALAEEAREAIESGELDTIVIPRREKPRDDDADLLIRNDNVFGEPHEDALRRDFTINGLFYDVERGEVIDYVGGLADLERKAVATIGLPDVRFREDPVRILRAIKFSARLDLGIDPEVYDAMVAQREELRKAAKARLLEEILRLLRGGAAHRSIWLCWDTGVLAVVLPELSVFLDDHAPRSTRVWKRLDAIDTSIKAGKVPSDSVLLSALLLGPIEEALEGARDPAGAYEEFMRSVNDSLAVPRRLNERMRAVVGSQRRLRAGRLGTMPQRDFFKDAVALLELESRARGIQPPDLREALEAVPTDGEVVMRRRRRRRRRA